MATVTAALVDLESVFVSILVHLLRPICDLYLEIFYFFKTYKLEYKSFKLKVICRNISDRLRIS